MKQPIVVASRGSGLEGDRTFHLGANASSDAGGRNYDFNTDPPPDLAVEVEMSHPADDAIVAWGRARRPRGLAIRRNNFHMLFLEAPR